MRALRWSILSLSGALVLVAPLVNDASRLGVNVGAILLCVMCIILCAFELGRLNR